MASVGMASLLQHTHNCDLKCMKCSGGHYNWAKYVAAALFPLAAVFIVVVTFQMNVKLPPMVTLVHIMHLTVVPQQLHTRLAAPTL